MRIDGKIYRYISISYFILHCFHAVSMLVGSFLPFVDGQNLYHVIDGDWPFYVLGYVGLAVGCLCAWRAVSRPHYCVASFLFSMAWHLIFILTTFFDIAGVTIGSAIAGQQVSVMLGLGSSVLSNGLLLIPVDITFIAYMFLLMFFESKSIK